jgi:hypothetical protein
LIYLAGVDNKKSPEITGISGPWFAACQFERLAAALQAPIKRRKIKAGIERDEARLTGEIGTVLELAGGHRNDDRELSGR